MDKGCALSMGEICIIVTAIGLSMLGILGMGISIGESRGQKPFMDKGIIKYTLDEKTGDKRLIWADGTDFKYE